MNKSTKTALKLCLLCTYSLNDLTGVTSTVIILIFILLFNHSTTTHPGTGSCFTGGSLAAPLWNGL